MMLSMKIYCLMSLIWVLGVKNLFTSLMNYFIGVLVILSFAAVFMYPSLSLLGSWGVVDSMSVGLVLLSGLVTFLMIYSSYKVKRYNENYLFYYVLMVLLYFVLIFSFFTSDLLMFYFYFEVSLIPTLMIIIGWGYQPERLQAGVYFIFYTLFASLPLLIFINYMYYYWGGLNFFTPSLILLKYNKMTGLIMSGVALMGSLAFLVKLPVYFGHLWLPKAHVEAPVAGSMILAGVLLKLGGYGLMRTLPFFYFFDKNLSMVVWGLSVVSMVYVGLLCVRLNDFKALVAYSSVAHMAMVICGLLSLYVWGWAGSFIMMISHGVSSSGLFCMVNLYYERSVSRSFYVNKGFLLVFPVFTLFLFLLAAANIAAPPTMNLVSEIFLMVSILSFDKLMFLVFPLGSFLGAVFTLFMFSYSQHGLIYYYVYSLTMPSFREYHTLVLHLLPVNFIFLNIGLFLLN